MEISNEEFEQLWQEVSKALVRLAKSISTEKETQWTEAINDFKRKRITEMFKNWRGGIKMIWM